MADTDNPLQSLDALEETSLDGVTLQHTIANEETEIYRLQWSPNGQSLALPCANGKVLLWDFVRGEVVQQIPAHTDRVHGVAWSPKEDKLASIGRDGRLAVWDVQKNQLVVEKPIHDKAALAIAWSPDGRWLACSVRTSIWLMDTTNYRVTRNLNQHNALIYGLVWSPDGRWLASAGADKTVILWDCETWQAEKTLTDHTDAVIHLAWSPDSRTLASCSEDKTVRLWDARTYKQTYVLEGHTSGVSAVSFSSDGRLIASKSNNGVVRLWSFTDSKPISKMQERRDETSSHLVGMQFHPHMPVLATLTDNDHTVRMWEIDSMTLIDSTLNQEAIHYVNAKVVLVGDTGVGKSGLGLVLAGQGFQRTESTHNRNVYVFDTDIHRNDGIHETRETLLWDLAGQPGYRLIHQLHLNDVALALVIYDARHEVDPFSGVFHWIKALQQAQRFNNKETPLKIFLVGARIDRGTVGVSKKRIQQMMETLGIDGHFETSAKEGWGVDELRTAIKKTIEWDALPRVSSTALFNQIKQFITQQRERGMTLVNAESLYLPFAVTVANGGDEELREQFQTCLELMASRGLVERLTFGDLILLQPELIDAYASALVNTARNEPDGLGFIAEQDALDGKLLIPSDARVKGKEQEKLFLIATVEKLLRHEVALRVQSDDAAYLVFPSQLTREHPNLPTPTGRTVKFRFEGVLLNIYATLVVRLAQSGLFRVKDMWKNAAVFTPIANNKGEVGVYLNELTDSEGELALFFNDKTNAYTRYQFEEYVYGHLRKRVVLSTLKRFAVVVCHSCNYVIPDQVVIMRQERDFDWINCPVCNTQIDLSAHKEEGVITPQDWINKMDKVANNQRDKAAAISTLSGKQVTEDYDVFLCHNGKDKPFVKKVGYKLQERGLLPWLDEWELQPGIPWQKLLEAQIQKVKAVAVFVGDNGIGPWQDQEQAAFIREFVRRGCPVIPVILPYCQHPPELPIFLQGMTWVDFRQSAPNPLQRLVWGITGKKENV